MYLFLIEEFDISILVLMSFCVKDRQSCKLGNVIWTYLLVHLFLLEFVDENRNEQSSFGKNFLGPSPSSHFCLMVGSSKHPISQLPLDFGCFSLTASNSSCSLYQRRECKDWPTCYFQLQCQVQHSNFGNILPSNIRTIYSKLHGPIGVFIKFSPLLSFLSNPVIGKW